MDKIKNIALVAHDNRKKDLMEWIEWNYTSIIEHKLICTGTTGKMVEKTLKKKLEKEDMWVVSVGGVGGVGGVYTFYKREWIGSNLLS